MAQVPKPAHLSVCSPALRGRADKAAHPRHVVVESEGNSSRTDVDKLMMNGYSLGKAVSERRDLGMDVLEKSFTGPTAELFDRGSVSAIEFEGHRAAGTEGVSADAV